MAAKNQIACFDKTWKVKNITLERNDLENDGNIRYTGHQCSPINCTLGTNFATRESIKHCTDIPVIIAF